jgi:adenine-specific DNA-methyltransferase
MPTLSFKGKSVVETYHHTVPHHTFEFDKKLSVLGKGDEPSLAGNLIIEGDNLLALKALLPTHAGKIKCVYIDPPYNTGNEGWVYNDNLTQPQFKEWIGQTVGGEGEDFCRHDKWCCMMYPRLQLLKELLTDDGSIWVSIGDDESHNLRHIMGEIFGDDNYIATVVWRNSTGPKLTNHLSTSHEYLLCFAKSAEHWARNLLPRSEEQESGYKNPDNDPRGPWRSGGLDARNPYSRGRYAITCPGGRVVDGPPGGSYWRIPEEKLWEFDADNRIWWGEDRNNVPRIKRFRTEVQDGIIPQSFWDYSDVGHTQEAKQEYLRILQDREVFTTPKPTRLIERVLEVATNEGDLVLDSFAGSGTTGHAVMKQNEQNGVDRQFILVQMPFDTKEHESEGINLCEKLTAERIRRVSRGYHYERRGAKGKNTQEEVSGLGGSFTYARLSDAPLFGDYRDLGDTLPSYDEIAAYIFYTETSHQWPGSDRRKNKAFDKKARKIGEHAGRSYYLLYTPNDTLDSGIDTEFLKNVASKDPNATLVVYSEKIWIHRDQLRAWEHEHGKRVRPMIVPFNLK